MPMDPATRDFILQQVVPTAGVITGTFMTFAPYRAVLKASRDGTLVGDLNPTPWVFMLGNCCGWLAYAFLLQNMYVFLPNAPGFILAIWLNIQAIKLQYENHRSAELQTAIVNALEDMKYSSSSKSKQSHMIRKDEVSALVEQVIEEAPPIDMIDPVTTAPVVEDDLSSDEGQGDGVDENGGNMSYNSTDNNCSRKHDHASRMDEAEQGMFMLGLTRNNSIVPPAVQEATEAIVDYASFIWEIAAQRSPAPASHELMVIGISIFWLVLITFVVFTQQILDESTRLLIVGVAVNINLIFFYGAPLSKIVSVLETKTSKLIHAPTMIFSLMNGTLWFIYGLVVGDPFIAIPNGFGAALGVVQAVLFLLFPRHTPHPSDYGGDGIFKRIGSTSSTATLSLPEESTPLI